MWAERAKSRGGNGATAAEFLGSEDWPRRGSWARTTMLGSSRRSRWGFSKRFRIGKRDGLSTCSPTTWMRVQATNHAAVTWNMAAGAVIGWACGAVRKET